MFTWFVEKRTNRAITAMDQYISKQKERLKDPTLDEEAKKAIEENIRTVERARADAEKSIVLVYMQDAKEGT